MLYAGEPRQNLDGTTSVKIMSTITPRRLQELGIMPKAYVEAKRLISLQLELTEDEGRVLMEMMQNPLGDVHPDEEDQTQSEVRSAIFYALRERLYGNHRDHVPEGPHYENPRHCEKSGADLFPNGMRARE